MQPNGGFFGSMMPQGATSFMPQGPSPASMIGGVNNTPAGFTGGQNPGALAALMAMLQQSQGGAAPGGAPMSGAPSALPPGATLAPGAALPPGGPMNAAQSGPGGPQAMPQTASGASSQLNNLMSMDPAVLKALMQRLGIGGGSAAPMAAPAPLQ
jgi:hypothetical protein